MEWQRRNVNNSYHRLGELEMRHYVLPRMQVLDHSPAHDFRLARQ